MANLEEKPCLTCLQPISPRYYGYSKPGFRVPIPPLGNVLHRYRIGKLGKNLIYVGRFQALI